MKFFAQSKVNWNRFRSTDIVFKSNAMVKKLVPSENILSYSTKSDRDVEMAKRSGGAEERKTSWNGQTYTYYSKDKYRAVHVKLKDLKSPYPTADLEFVDFTPKKDSVGNTFNHITSLVYICSFHQRHNGCKVQMVNTPLKWLVKLLNLMKVIVLPMVDKANRITWVLTN